MALRSFLLFIILFIGNKSLPLQWGYASPESLKYYTLTVGIVLLYILEAIAIVWLLSFLFKKKHSSMFIWLAVIIGLSDMMMNIKVQKIRVNSHLGEHGIVAKATVSYIEKRHGKVYYRLHYEYMDAKYLTLSDQIYNKKIAEKTKQGDTVLILISETYPEIFDIISFGH